ncbi:MAG: hypothetical protein NDJ94_01060 [Vicinamibacteria bacterium]|nr:hypothetical protein [Vicinamibacteria bacterium]
MRRLGLNRAILLISGILAAACGGGGSPSAPSTPTPTLPARSSLTVSQNGTALLGISPSPLHVFRLRVPFRVVESAGLGARMNFVRLQLYRGASEIERAELGAVQIEQGLGSNVIRASQTTSFSANFDFNSTTFDFFRMTFSFTDDRGNAHSAEISRLTDVQVFPGLLAMVPDGAGFRLVVAPGPATD